MPQNRWFSWVETLILFLSLRKGWVVICHSKPHPHTHFYHVRELQMFCENYEIIKQEGKVPKIILEAENERQEDSKLMIAHCCLVARLLFSCTRMKKKKTRYSGCKCSCHQIGLAWPISTRGLGVSVIEWNWAMMAKANTLYMFKVQPSRGQSSSQMFSSISSPAALGSNKPRGQFLWTCSKLKQQVGKPLRTLKNVLRLFGDSLSNY